MKVSFAGGEVKLYSLPLDPAVLENAVIHYNWHIFTDKIFANGWLAEHRQKPEDEIYHEFPEYGQGISFINGFRLVRFSFIMMGFQ